MIRFQGRLRRFRQAEGFGLVEAVAALGVLVVALLMLAYLATSALNDIGLARQRQGGNEIANRVIEQVRALPYTQATVEGHLTSDLSGDPNVDTTCVDGIWRFGDCSGEELVHSANSPQEPPLVPHVVAGVPVEGSPTTYTRALYITRADPGTVPAAGAFRVTVIVSWDGVFRPGAASQVESQTLLFNPGLAGAAFGGTSSIPQGGISISGTFSGKAETVGVRADVQSSGGIDRIQGRATASVVSMGGSSPPTAGGDSVPSDADNDDTTAADAYDSNTLISTGGSVSNASGGVTLTFQTGAVSGSTTSAVQAAGTHACPLVGSQTDGLPCGHSLAEQGGDLSGSLNANVTVGGLVVNLGAATLFSMDSTGFPAETFVDREAVPGGDGRIEVSGTRRLGDVGFFGVPTALVPASPNWDGFLIRLTGYEDTVTAQAGNETGPPTTDIDDGARLTYWDQQAGDYVVLPFGGSTATVTADLSSTVNTVPVRLQFDGSVSGGNASVSDPAGGGSNIDRFDASAQVSSPVLGTFTYRLSVGPPLLPETVLANLSFDVNFGTHIAAAQYIPLP